MVGTQLHQMTAHGLAVLIGPPVTVTTLLTEPVLGAMQGTSADGRSPRQQSLNTDGASENLIVCAPAVVCEMSCVKCASTVSGCLLVTGVGHRGPGKSCRTPVGGVGGAVIGGRIIPRQLGSGSEPP